MIINELQLTHFGKFHGKVLRFEDGVNILHGRNEAGKSTIHTFIECMLFGMDSRQRGRSYKTNVYKMYEPWENMGGYEGTMTFTQWGKCYRIERSFLKSNSYVRLINTTDGVELKPAQEHILALIGDMSQTAYRNTVSIGQLHSATDEGLVNELRNHMANLGAAQSVEIDLARAKAQLLNAKKEFEKKIVSGAQEQYRNVCGSLQDSDIRLEQLCHLEHDTQERLELARQQEYNLFHEQKEQRHSYEQEIQANRERLVRLEHERERWEQEKNAWGDKTKLTQEELLRGKEPKKTTGGLLFAYLALVLSLGVGVFYMYDVILSLANHRIYKYMFSEYIGPLCVVTALLCLMGIVYGRRKSKQRAYAYKMYLEKEKAFEEAADTTDHLNSRLAVLQDKMDEIERSDYMHLVDTNNQMEKEVLRYSWELEQEQTRYDNLSRELDAIEEICNKNNEYETEIAAIELALKTMAEVAVQIQDSFGKQLNEKASAYLAVVTKGIYSKIVIDEDYNISLNTKNKLVHLEQVSRGTMEQIYLCVRLAAADMMYPKYNLPLFLDDTFAYYDDGRTSDTLLLLKRLNCQVIILTCHAREQEMMRTIS